MGAVRFQPIQPVGGVHVCKLLLKGGGGGGGAMAPPWGRPCQSFLGLEWGGGGGGFGEQRSEIAVCGLTTSTFRQITHQTCVTLVNCYCCCIAHGTTSVNSAG